MPSTDSFTSSATATSQGTTGTLTDLSPGAGGLAVNTPRGFRIKTVAAGVYITKAPSLGGAQAALSMPLSRTDAQDLATALLEATT